LSDTSRIRIHHGADLGGKKRSPFETVVDPDSTHFTIIFSTAMVRYRPTAGIVNPMFLRWRLDRLFEMQPSRFEPSRRSLLSAATIGGTGVAGCLDDESTVQTDPEQTVQPTTSQQRQEPTGSAASGRSGNEVFYNPDERGPYADGQAALADVPPGGTLRLSSGVYDVESEGRLVIEKPMVLRGDSERYTRSNTSTDSGRDKQTHGTRIDNTGSVDEPAVEIRAPSEDDILQGATVRGVWIVHNGRETPGLRFRNAINTVLIDSNVSCAGKSPVAVKYEKNSFFARGVRARASGYTDIGFHVTGNGYSHEFYSCWAGSSQPGATHLQTERHRTIVVGGEYGGRGPDATSIRFYNPSNEPLYGGLVLEPGIEHAARCIDVDGESAFHNVQCYHTMLSLYAQESDTFPGGGSGIRFGNARNCKVIFPIAHTGGKLAHWTPEARNCSVITDPSTLSATTYTDEGSLSPYIHLVGSAEDRIIDVLPTGVPTHLTHATDHGSPVIHDGESWQRVATKSFSP
jgi:hypothetical protein